MRKEKLQQLAAMTEQQVKFQSESQHHRMRFSHLQLLARYWAAHEEGLRLRESKSFSPFPRELIESPPDGLEAYVGRLRLCVPVVRERAA